MSERGFLPFTTVGFLLLLLTVVMLGEFAWVRHQLILGGINSGADDLLLTSVAGVQSDIERAVRYSIYEALWEISKHADGYTSRGERENAAENLAARGLEQRLFSLVKVYRRHNTLAKLVLGQGSPSLELQPEERGYVLASVKLPKRTYIEASLLDNTLKLKSPYENFKTFIDSRFYLLDEMMGDFISGMEEVLDGWKYAEYALAYGQAWLGRKVIFSESKSRALFQLGWASHELSVFGSSDYLSTLQDLSGINGAVQLFEDYDPNVVVEPVSAEEIHVLTEKIDASLKELRRSEEKLMDSLAAVRGFKTFDADKWADRIQIRFEGVEKALDSLNVDEAEQRFCKLCENFEFTYSYLHKLLDEAVADIEEAQVHVRGVQEKFQQLLSIVKSSTLDNPLMKQLYEDLVIGSNGNIPLAQQISWGVSDVLQNLGQLGGEISVRREQFVVPSRLNSIFPGDLREKFTQIINENLESAGEALREAREAAGEAICEFKVFVDRRENLRISLLKQISGGVQNLLQKPDANWSGRYEDYPDPGEDPEAVPFTTTAEKYVLMQGKGSIGGLRLVLESTRSHFERFEDLARRFESLQGEMSRLELDDGLRKVLDTSFQSPQGLNREQAYELAPPKPINPRPGISVFHEFEIKSVNYERLDPCGWVDPKAPPTPIFLWFIGVTIYWAQWEVTLELEEWPIEEIFDYDNPSLPRPMLDGSSQNLINVHKSLAYRSRVPRSSFSFSLVLLSLRPFGIGVSD